MMMKARERWYCTNAACRCSILVETSGITGRKNPLCACGGVMKKQYAPPVFRYLDFLRFPEPEPALQHSQED